MSATVVQALMLVSANDVCVVAFHRQQQLLKGNKNFDDGQNLCTDSHLPLLPCGIALMSPTDALKVFGNTSFGATAASPQSTLSGSSAGSVLGRSGGDTSHSILWIYSLLLVECIKLTSEKRKQKSISWG